MNVEDIKIVGIVGAGVMGNGIAQVFARNGYEVILVDISEKILEKALENIKTGPYGLKKLVEKGKICKKDTIFASNTSGIMISSIATAIERKEKFIGMHWFNPAQIMRLIEVVRGALTSEETFQITMEISKKLGKIPIPANDAPGFFTTRFINSWLMEAIRLYEANVAGIKEIDEMCKLAFGFPMGPFELMDLIGLDTVLHIAEYMFEETKEAHYAPPVTLKKLVLSGYLGDKRLKFGSKGGWYDFFQIRR
jgi:3-hydroxybutyryl-CoA dehydrogenase